MVNTIPDSGRILYEQKEIVIALHAEICSRPKNQAVVREQVDVLLYIPTPEQRNPNPFPIHPPLLMYSFIDGPSKGTALTGRRRHHDP